jgi:predicted CopG family antitoxin
MQLSMSQTTIRIDHDVRDRLKALGRMGESYNDVLRRVLSTIRAADETQVLFPPKTSTATSRPLFPHGDRK